MTDQPRSPGLLFHVAAGATALFVLTVLVMIVTVFAEPASPLNKWLNRYGIVLLLGEVAAIAISGCAAMARDKRSKPHDE